MVAPLILNFVNLVAKTKKAVKAHGPVKATSAILDKILNDKWFWILMVVLFGILAFSRAMPYLLHGPFGFGYDVGIYKNKFDSVVSLNDVLNSAIYPLPTFLAYLFNLLGIPLKYLMYHAHILFSVLVAVPLYLLTKEFFGRTAGISAIAIFTVSYSQILASEFYLYKAVLGAVFLLFALLYYSRKSWLFYLFAGLLALTQLPQFLVLAVGVGIAGVFGFKKYWKFHLVGVVLLLLVMGGLYLLAPQHIDAGVKIMKGAFGEVGNWKQSHYSGLFSSFEVFLEREFLFILMGIGGLILSYGKKGVLALQGSLLFVFGVVVFELFFEKRFVVELGLLLIPFMGCFLAYVFRKVLKVERMKVVVSVVMVMMTGLLTFSYYRTTFPSLTPYEVWAMDVVRETDDVDSFFVPNTFYAPWMYGFSGKTVMAPGIFKSVWGIEEWSKYNSTSGEERAKMLIELADKHGDYLLYLGIRGSQGEIDLSSGLIEKIFDVNRALVYKVSVPPEDVVDEDGSYDGTVIADVSPIGITTELNDDFVFSGFPYYLEGETVNTCSKVSVFMENVPAGLKSEYVLTEYEYGDTYFKYGLNKYVEGEEALDGEQMWGNLGEGMNKYVFTAYCDDKSGNPEGEIYSTEMLIPFDEDLLELSPE